MLHISELGCLFHFKETLRSYVWLSFGTFRHDPHSRHETCGATWDTPGTRQAHRRTCSEHPMEHRLPCLSNDSSNVAAMRAGDDEETSVDLLQTAGNFVHLFDCSHEYYASSPVWWPGLKNSPTVTHACLKRRLLQVGFGRWTNNPALYKGYCYETPKGEARARPGL
jgi:hypothetical protein